MNRTIWSICCALLVAMIGAESAPLALGQHPLAASRPVNSSAIKPNVILILADDLGFGDLGCFGQKLIQTPNIDRLAREGTRFTDVYSGSPVCAPSRCVLLTGLHSGHARIRENTPASGGELESFGEGDVRLSLTASDHTVASTLKAAGYVTGAAGKWGVGEPGTAGTPGRHGFDEWLGYLNQNHAAYYYTDYLWRNEERRPIPENTGRAGSVYSNDLFRDFALEFIEHHRRERFFLYLPVTLPHARLEVPSLGQYAHYDWPEEMKLYAAMVSRLDGYVGEIVATLDRLGLAQDTLVIFSSDNGPVSGKRCEFFRSAGSLRGAKSTLYEGGIRVPTIARWPGRVPAGRVSHTPWAFVDVFPTLAALAEAEPPSGLDGQNITQELLGIAAAASERSLYWELPRKPMWQAARHGRWKAVRLDPAQPLELYDLAEDPGETRNVASAHPTVVADLERYLNKEHTPSPHWPDTVQRHSAPQPHVSMPSLLDAAGQQPSRPSASRS